MVQKTIFSDCSRRQLITRIVLPQMLPRLIDSLRLSLGAAWLFLIAAEAICGKPSVRDWKCVPAVIFTDPEVASVGLTEAEAVERGHEVAVGKFPFAANGRALSLMETEGFTMVVADKATDEVLGVHMVGPEVTEMIGEAALAL